MRAPASSLGRGAVARAFRGAGRSDGGATTTARPFEAARGVVWYITLHYTTLHHEESSGHEESSTTPPTLGVAEST